MSQRLAATAAGLSLAVVASFAFAGPAAADPAGTRVGASGGISYRWVGNSVDRDADNHRWTDPDNWSPKGVPGTLDNVRIEGPANACTATVDEVPQVLLNSLEIVPGTGIGGACFTSLTGGPVTVVSSFLWSGGTIDADLSLAEDAVGRIDDVTYPLTQQGDISVSGELFVSDTEVDVNGDGLSDRSLTIERPSRLTVQSGGRLVSQGDNRFDYTSCCTDPGRVINNGSLEVSGGTLVLDRLGFDQRAAVQVEAGSALVSHGGLATAATGSTWSGSGEYRLRSTVESHFHGTQTVAGGFELALGTNGKDLAGSALGGTFSVVGSGSVGWYGGTLEAGLTVGKGVALNIVGAATGNNERRLYGRDYTPGGSKTVSVVNHGDILIGSGVTLETNDGAHLLNAPDGRLDIRPGVTVEAQRCCVAPDRITNQGTLLLQRPAFSAAADAPVAVRNVSFVNSGRIELPAGLVFQVLGGAPATIGRSSIVGTGRLVLDTPTLLAGGTTLANRPTIALTGTVLDLRGTTTARGHVLLTGGTVINRDQLTVSALTATRLSITGNFTQVAGANLLLDARPEGADLVAVGKRASIAGTVTVRNAGRWAPANGKRTSVVSANSGVAWGGRVVTVRGYLAPRINHWVATPSARWLTLTARAG